MYYALFMTIWYRQDKIALLTIMQWATWQAGSAVVVVTAGIRKTKALEAAEKCKGQIRLLAMTPSASRNWKVSAANKRTEVVSWRETRWQSFFPYLLFKVVADMVGVRNAADVAVAATAVWLVVDVLVAIVYPVAAKRKRCKYKIKVSEMTQYKAVAILFLLLTFCNVECMHSRRTSSNCTTCCLCCSCHSQKKALQR